MIERTFVRSFARALGRAFAGMHPRARRDSGCVLGGDPREREAHTPEAPQSILRRVIEPLRRGRWGLSDSTPAMAPDGAMRVEPHLTTGRKDTPCDTFRAPDGWSKCLVCGWGLGSHRYEMDTDLLSRVIAGEVHPTGQPRKPKGYTPEQIEQFKTEHYGSEAWKSWR